MPKPDFLCGALWIVGNGPYAERRWLRPHRQSGVISNPNCAVTFMSIGSQCKQVIAPPRARGRRPRRAVEERCARMKLKARLKRNARFAQRQIVRFSLYRVRGLFDAAHCGQSGTALTPGGRWLRPHRQSSIISNPNCAVTFMSIGSQCKQVTAPPRARGRRPRRAVEERCCLRIKPAQRETYDLCNGKSCVSLFIAFAGFLMQRIVASPELPSRRAGGGFGHSE